MNILVTTGSWNASLIVMESLAKQGHNIYLLDQDPYSAGFHSKYCKEGILTPVESTGSQYVDAVADIVRSRHFDLLIPTSDLSTEFLSAYRERVLPHVPMLLPSKELIELARFKDKAYHFALQNDITIPQTYFPKSLNDVSRLAKDLIFPCVVKKSRGTANKGNAYIDNKGKLIDYYEHLIPEDGWPMIQEFVKGEFYGFLAVADQGELLDCLMFKAEQRYATGGTALYCCSIDDEKFLNTTRRIVKLLNWTGAINMDFIRGQDGRWRFLEINPRLSGSMPFAYKLGVDLPAVYLALARGQAPKKFERIHYKPGIVFRFVLPMELIYASNNKRHLPIFFGNFLNLKMKTDIPWHDPVLLLWKLKHLRWHWQDEALALEGMHGQIV